MLRKIKLYGELATFVGHKEFEDIGVNSAAQAVSFLINNFPQLEPYMSDKYYKVIVGDYDLSETELHHPAGTSDIKFVPVISGAGRGLGKILLGAAMIGLAFATGGASFSFSTGFTFSSSALGGAFVAKAVTYVGAALVLSGVSDMLFPVPKPKEFSSEQDPRLSFSFSGTQQTSRAGTPVPICYGEIFTGSVVISGAIDTQQVQA